MQGGGVMRVTMIDMETLCELHDSDYGSSITPISFCAGNWGPN